MSFKPEKNLKNIHYCKENWFDLWSKSCRLQPLRINYLRYWYSPFLIKINSTSNKQKWIKTPTRQTQAHQRTISTKTVSWSFDLETKREISLLKETYQKRILFEKINIKIFKILSCLIWTNFPSKNWALKQCDLVVITSSMTSR